ncbi:CdaR family transcriptional regulator [Robertmurraya sp. FSL R5-0851]|uniref:CdaR family transcriptional regulator n=1 Tax=Robertmurraya sp. FSL R5-0851 TaxID=2921584 RepID=UPI0030FB47E5
MIRPSLAKNIISEVKKFLEEDLIVVDIYGTIIASTDEYRVGSFHEGALICYRERKKVIITEQDQLLLKGVKAGINLPVFFQNQIVGIIGITGNPNQVSQYGEIIRKMTELLITESYYSEQMEWQARVLEAFVFDWVQKKEWSGTFLNQAELLGIDLHINRQVIIGHYLSEGREIIQTNIWKDIMPSFMMNSDDVFVRWGNERLVILHGVHGIEKKQQTLQFTEKLKNFLNERINLNISFGIGEVVPPQVLYQSFKHAERALTVARRTSSIVFDDDLRLEMCLEDIKKETRVEFVNRTIAPILNETELIDTLKTFLGQNQSFKGTSDALHIHINTLHYRLKRIEQLTNLNPRDIHDMTTLYLALTFLDDYLKN